MAKVLVVGIHPSNPRWSVLLQGLRALGIDADFAYAQSKNATVQTPAGAFASGSPDLRNYFKQYDAVLVVEQSGVAWNNSGGIRAAVRWLGWNNADDTPIAYLGWHFGTANTEIDGELPADFPLIRINPSDDATYAFADSGAAIAWNTRSKHGTPVYFVREQATIYVPTICMMDGYTGNYRVLYWRFNPTTHSTLANQTYSHRVALNERAGELLVVPASLPPDGDTYPTNTVIGYRYYNRFFLPRPVVQGQGYRWHYPLEEHHIFWLLYALKVCGVAPQRAIPLQIETDHPLELRPQSANLTDFQKAVIKRECFAWWRDFCSQTGLVVVNGVQVGGRDRQTDTTRHWRVINHSDPDIRAVFQQAHQILVDGHREGVLPCGPHDHTINDTRGYGARREMSNFTRHADAGFRYAAPNNVPIQHGRVCVARHVCPSGAAGADAIETVIGDDTIVEWDFTGRTSDTGATIATMPMQNVHAARMILESDIAEMLALGFPDGYCGEHRYTNTAANNSGGLAYWQAAKELGFKAIRSGYCCNEHSTSPPPGGNNQTVPPNWVWEGFHLLINFPLDIASSSEPSTWGLYDPDAGGSNRHAVGYFGLDSSTGDISSIWTSDLPTAAWRAHQRALCRLTGDWLSINVVYLGAAYIHPAWSWYGANPSEPVARFEDALSRGWLNANNQPHWNPTVELMENMREIVRVLSGYVKFGSITELMDLRERVMGV